MTDVPQWLADAVEAAMMNLRRSFSPTPPKVAAPTNITINEIGFMSPENGPVMIDFEGGPIEIKSGEVVYLTLCYSSADGWKANPTIWKPDAAYFWLGADSERIAEL